MGQEAEKRRLARQQALDQVAAEEKKKKQQEELQERERLMQNSGPRRKIKVAIASMQKALFKYELTNLQREDLETKIKRYQKELKNVGHAASITRKTIEEHMLFLSSDENVAKMMRTFWCVMLPHTDRQGCVKKESYIKIQMLLQFALSGNLDDKLAEMAALENWGKDIQAYGKIDQEAFFDIIYEIVTVWLELFDPLSYTTFIWGIIDSVFNTSRYPARFRVKRVVRCITREDTEGTLLQSWFYSRDHIDDILLKSITSLSESEIETLTYTEGDDVRFDLKADEQMDVAVRVQSRKEGRLISEADSDMMYALGKTSENQRLKDEKLNGVSSGHEDTDTEEEGEEEEEDDLYDTLTTTGETSRASTAPSTDADTRNAHQNEENEGNKSKSSMKKKKKSATKGYDPDFRSGFLDLHLEGADALYGKSQLSASKRLYPEGENWIGAKQGNIFYGRGTYKKGHKESFQQYLFKWMRNRGIKGESDMGYVDMAQAKSEWLNETSKKTQDDRLNARLEEDRIKMESLMKKNYEIQTVGTGARNLSRLEIDRIDISTKEVMDLIKALQPPKDMGQSIPSHFERRIPDAMLTGSGEINTDDERIRFSDSDFDYAPLYQYHSPQHIRAQMKLKRKLKPTESKPLRRLLDKVGTSLSNTSISRGDSIYSLDESSAIGNNNYISDLGSVNSNLTFESHNQLDPLSDSRILEKIKRERRSREQQNLILKRISKMKQPRSISADDDSVTVNSSIDGIPLGNQIVFDNLSHQSLIDNHSIASESFQSPKLAPLSPRSASIGSRDFNNARTMQLIDEVLFHRSKFISDHQKLKQKSTKQRPQIINTIGIDNDIGFLQPSLSSSSVLGNSVQNSLSSSDSKRSVKSGQFDNLSNEDRFMESIFIRTGKTSKRWTGGGKSKKNQYEKSIFN